MKFNLRIYESFSKPASCWLQMSVFCAFRSSHTSNVCWGAVREKQPFSLSLSWFGKRLAGGLQGLLAGLGMMALAGCASGILPSNVAKSKAPWETYDQAKAAFDSVTLGKTTFEELKSYGFDAKSWPNVKVINYVEVAGLFGSAFDRKYLPEGIRKCVVAEDGCTAYVMHAQNIHAKRNGNIAADLFGFRKQTHTTGWEMTATVVLVDKVVVYKLWSGTPEIDTYEKSITPLGPVQNMGGLLKPF